MTHTVLKIAAVDHFFERRQAVDQLLAKASNVTLVARVARIERELRRYLEAKWNVLSEAAVDEAGRLARQGALPDRIERAVRNIMRRWPDEVRGRIRSDAREAYWLSRTAAWQHALGRSKVPLTYTTKGNPTVLVKAPPAAVAINPSFSLIDETAVERIGNHQELWIGDHYDRHVSQVVRESAKQTSLIEGRGRAQAGRDMERSVRDSLGIVATPAGFLGDKEQYFEGLAANAVTTSRSFGHLVSFGELGVTHYEIDNPSDDRTCAVCSHMIGKEFSTRQGLDTMEAELGANSKEGVRDAHPWLHYGNLTEISEMPGNVGAADSSALAARGLNVPPFHFRCRCAIVVSDTSIFGPSQMPEVGS